MEDGLINTISIEDNLLPSRHRKIQSFVIYEFVVYLSYYKSMPI